MNAAQGTLWNYEPVFLQPELLRAALKDDNRGLTAATLRFWPLAQNPRDKVSAADGEFPPNDTLALLAEGYADAFEAPA